MLSNFVKIFEYLSKKNFFKKEWILVFIRHFVHLLYYTGLKATFSKFKGNRIPMMFEMSNVATLRSIMVRVWQGDNVLE